jgi:replicative DNA helicase
MDSFQALKARVPLQAAMMRYAGTPLTAAGNGALKGKCPLHDDGTASMWVYPNGQYHCFGCSRHGDVITLTEQLFNLPPREALKKLDADFSGAGEITGRTNPDEGKMRDPQSSQQASRDFVPYFRRCRENLRDTDYWKRRGLSLETCRRFMIGYDPHFIHPKYWNGERPKYSAPCLIIPTSRGGFAARVISGGAGIEKMRAGQGRLFNAKGYREAAKAPVFVVEGELDALSIIQSGGVALSIGGVEGVKEFLSFIEGGPPKQLIIALDNDGPGKAAQRKLCEALDERKSPYSTPDLYGRYKDANECLINESAEFSARILKGP